MKGIASSLRWAFLDLRAPASFVMPYCSFFRAFVIVEAVSCLVVHELVIFFALFFERNSQKNFRGRF